MKPSTAALIFVILYFISSIWLCRGYLPKIRDVSIGAIACALTSVFSFFVIPLPTGAMPAICTSVPLILVALLYDHRLAIISGWVMGILAIVLMLPGWQPVHWAQIIVEHMVCFSCLGYAGLFGFEPRKKMWIGVIATMLLQFISHFLSGAVFFSSNAWGGWSAWGYSFIYNMSHVATQAVFTVIVLSVIPLNSLKFAISGRK